MRIRCLCFNVQSSGLAFFPVRGSVAPDFFAAFRLACSSPSLSLSHPLSSTHHTMPYSAKPTRKSPRLAHPSDNPRFTTEVSAADMRDELADSAVLDMLAFLQPVLPRDHPTQILHPLACNLLQNGHGPPTSNLFVRTPLQHFFLQSTMLGTSPTWHMRTPSQIPIIRMLAQTPCLFRITHPQRPPWLPLRHPTTLQLEIILAHLLYRSRATRWRLIPRSLSRR